MTKLTIHELIAMQSPLPEPPPPNGPRKPAYLFMTKRQYDWWMTMPEEDRAAGMRWLESYAASQGMLPEVFIQVCAPTVVYQPKLIPGQLPEREPTPAKEWNTNQRRHLMGKKARW